MLTDFVFEIWKIFQNFVSQDAGGCAIYIYARGGAGRASPFGNAARDGQNPQRLDKRQGQVRLHVEAPVFGAKPPQEGAPAAMPADIARKLLEKRPAAGGAAGHRRLKLRGKFGAAMHQTEIEEDVDIQQIFRAGPPHPPADGLPPSGQ